MALLIAVGVNAEGYWEVMAVPEGSKEDKESWVKFLREMKERGLKGVKLFVSDKCLGLIETLADFYPQAHWQRCGSPICQPPLFPSASSVVHWYHNVWTEVPAGKVKEVAGDAQSHPCAGRPGSGAWQGARGHRKAAGDEAAQGSRVCDDVGKMAWRNLEIHVLPAEKLARTYAALLADVQPAAQTLLPSRSAWSVAFHPPFVENHTLPAASIAPSTAKMLRDHECLAVADLVKKLLAPRRTRRPARKSRTSTAI